MRRRRIKNARARPGSIGACNTGRAVRLAAALAAVPSTLHGQGWWVPVTVLRSGVASRLFCAASPSTFPSLSHRRPLPFGEESVRNFFRHRCGLVSHSGNIDGDYDDDEDQEGASGAIWAYEGTLTDPTTGRVVAEVEGLELVRPLSLSLATSPSSRASWGLRRLGDLSVTKLLHRNDNGNDNDNEHEEGTQWDSTATFLSRKLFCYRRPDSDGYSDGSRDPSGTLLTTHRMRPDGPIRHLSIDESVAVFDSAVTYISRDDGREMVVHSERPDGSCTMGSARSVLGSNTATSGSGSSGSGSGGGGSDIARGGSGSEGESFDFTIHSRSQGASSTTDGGGLFLPPLRRTGNKNSKGQQLLIAPPRTKFLQFGKGNGAADASEKKYGSIRETFSYSFGGGAEASSSGSAGGSDESTVRYTRYGEAPPWYAPGHMCTLELRGRRVTTPTKVNNGGERNTSGPSLPPLALWVSSNHVPSFWSGWPVEQRVSQNNEKQPPLDIVEMFRGNGVPIPLVIKGGEKEIKTDGFVSFAQSCARRLSKSLVMDELHSP